MSFVSSFFFALLSAMQCPSLTLTYIHPHTPSMSHLQMTATLSSTTTSVSSGTTTHAVATAMSLASDTQQQQQQQQQHTHPSHQQQQSVYRVPYISDLDEAVNEYLVMRGFSAIANQFLNHLLSMGGSVVVPHARLFHAWRSSVLAPSINKETSSKLLHTITKGNAQLLASSLVNGNEKCPIERTSRHQHISSAGCSSVSVAPSCIDTPSVTTANVVATTNLRPSDRTQICLHECPAEGCSATFTKFGNLKRHMMLHSKERPYRCPQVFADGQCCGRSFARRADLVSHLRIHTGEKPFQCSECGMRFPRNSDWRIHMRLTHKLLPYACPVRICAQRFYQKRCLRQHVQKYHPSVALPATSSSMDSASNRSIDIDDSRFISSQLDIVPDDTTEGVVASPDTSPTIQCNNSKTSCSGHLDDDAVKILHGDHYDFLVGGSLHYWHDGHCDDHGEFTIGADTFTSMGDETLCTRSDDAVMSSS